MRNEFDPIESESGHALFDRTSVNSLFADVAAGRLVTGLQHNSLVIALTMAQDAIANPLATSANAANTNAYQTTRYSGDFPGYSVIPVVGVFDPPSDDDGLKNWMAIQRYVERIACPARAAAEPATPAAPVSGSTLYEVRGPNADALIPHDCVSYAPIYREDADAISIAATFYTAVYVYAQRRLALLRGSTRPEDRSANPAESYEAGHVSLLSSEGLARRNAARKAAWLVLGGVVVTSVAAKSLA